MHPDDQAAQSPAGAHDVSPSPTGPGRLVARVDTGIAAHLSARAVLYVTAAVGAVLVVGMTAAFAVVYDAVAEDDGVAGLDQPALQLAVAQRSPLLTTLVNAFTQLGGPIGMTVIASLITLVMVWRWRSRTPLVLMVIAVAGALTMTNVGKAIVGRARPPLSEAVPPYEYAFSFPSGHTLNSTVIAGLVAYLLLRHLRRRWARLLTVVLAAAWAVAMGLSRVYLGHHWLTDVIAAWALGLAWVALVITAHQLFLTVRRSRQGPGVADDTRNSGPAQTPRRSSRTASRHRERPTAMEKSARVAAALIMTMLALTGCTSAVPVTRHSPSPSPPTMQNSHSPTAAQSSAGVGVDKLLVIVEENQSAHEVAATMPFFRSQSRRYGNASHYYALTHPSLPNYLAVVGGSTFGIADDHDPAQHPLSGSSVFAQLLSAGHTAKTYAEGMPGNCALRNHGTYAVRHNPWTYFADPAEHAACRRFDVPAGTPQSGALAGDVRAGQLPTFALLVPDVCHDGHDCSAAVTDSWLADWLPTLQDGPDFRSGRLAIIVTWDEDDDRAGNHIPLAVLHPSLRGKTVDARLDHLALSAAISRLAGKPPLRGARSAPDLLEQFGL